MSEVWQGPGWWMASDGKWYPPELHPYYPPPVPPLPPRGNRLAVVSVVVALIVVALGVTVLAVASPGSSTGSGQAHSTAPVYIAPLTGFAGYHCLCGLHQIGAQWRVPAITAKSPPGHASTWIGAQGDGGNSPFIQVGVTEDKFGPGDAIYEAFWSDPAVSFHPQPLGPLDPGDLITASMTRGSEGWTVTVDDQTSRTPATKLIPYGSGDSFISGEWIQEDPTDSSEAAADLPYPETSTVSFHKLMVDGQRPQLDLTDGQVLIAADGITLVPSTVRSDGFTLSAPTGVDATYLHDAGGLDAAVSAYNVEFASWSSLSLATRANDVQRLSAAYQTNASELKAQPWPPAARPDIAALTNRLLRLVGDLRAWKAAGLETTGNAFVTLRIDQEIAPAADKVRADLGLPPD